MRRARPLTKNTLEGPDGLLRRLSADRLNGALEAAAEEVREAVESEIIKRTPYDGGALESGVEVMLLEDEAGRFRIVATARAIGDNGQDYAPYVEEGTGEFGPAHRRIRARNPKGMVFNWRKPGAARDYGGFRPGVWRMHSTAGQKGQHFFEHGWRNGIRIARKRMRARVREI